MPPGGAGHDAPFPSSEQDAPRRRSRVASVRRLMTFRSMSAGTAEEAEDPAKPATTILRQEISSGTTQLERPTAGLLLSAISAGLDLGFGPALMAAVRAATTGDGLSVRVALSLAYSIGFVIVVLGRSELFTEHTTLAILPLLSRQTTLRKIGRLWLLVYTGNVIGGAVFAALVGSIGLHLGIFSAANLDAIAQRILEPGWRTMFASAIVAGWMMGLVSWLVTASRETISQIFSIVLLTGAIAFLRLHHCIAGTIEVLLSVFYGSTGAGGWLRFLVIASAGNAAGGTTFVALVKYGHVRFPGPHVVPDHRG